MLFPARGVAGSLILSLDFYAPEWSRNEFFGLFCHVSIVFKPGRGSGDGYGFSVTPFFCGNTDAPDWLIISKKKCPDALRAGAGNVLIDCSVLMPIPKEQCWRRGTRTRYRSR
jgi:hypothetical protein